ncbi:MAG: hypothetical protein M0P15_10370 [Bacteroides sp.]|nr:hypothetical protein [Bacteroides sp.]
MNKIFISENNCNQSNMTYLYNSMSESIVDCKAQVDLDIDDKRVNVTYSVDEKYHDFLKQRLEEKIAEIIAISYKYYYFKNNIKTSGLSDDEFEFLLASLISADFEDDKRFIKNKLKRISIYTIDGFFNFRLNALKNKWSEIAGYIPSYFNCEQLKDFISFLINDNNKGRKVFVDGENVYDKFYNKLDRSSLLQNNFSKGKLITELILSGCDQIELRSKVGEYEEKYLKEFYSGRVIFAKNYFS